MPLVRFCKVCKEPAHHICQIAFEAKHGLEETLEKFCHACYCQKGGICRTPENIDESDYDWECDLDDGSELDCGDHTELSPWGNKISCHSDHPQPQDVDSLSEVGSRIAISVVCGHGDR